MKSVKIVYVIFAALFFGGVRAAYDFLDESIYYRAHHGIQSMKSMY